MQKNKHFYLQICLNSCKVRLNITTLFCSNQILKRIKNWYEKQLLDQQQGLKKGRGTTYGIYVINETNFIQT